MKAIAPRGLTERMNARLGAQVTGVWRRLPWPARIAAIVVVGLVVVAVVGPHLAPYSATRNLVGPPAGAPSGAHWFGTDLYGRDVLSRVIVGSRVSVLAGLLTPLLALVIGAVLGATAAVVGQPLRHVMEWILDLLVTFPSIIIAVALVSLLRPTLSTTILVLSALYAPAVARVVRAAVLGELGKEYVLVEEFMGASLWWLVTRHVARNVAGPVVVFASSLAGTAVLTEAALSFLGLSVQPPTPSWGNIVNDGHDLISSGGWWVTAFGGLATFVAVLALSVLSDGLAAVLATAQSQAGETPRSESPVVRARATAALRAGPSLLEVRDLAIRFPTAHGGRAVVSGVSFDIREGETIGLVGESGSGKSLTTLAITGLLPPGAEVSGSIRFRGEELVGMAARQRRRLLGSGIAMIYQDALTALNPGMRVAAQLKQVCRRFGRHSPAELLELVQLSPERILHAYPHQLSGGQRQRVLIALALAGDPALLLADEPTTALDATIQAEIAELLRRLVAEHGLSMLLVSHDLAFVAELSTRINVMYAGEIVEAGPVGRVLDEPRHRYTAALTAAVTALEQRRPVAGPADAAVPTAGQWPPGCRFSDRCHHATPRCAGTPPPWSDEQDRGFACHHPVHHLVAASAPGDPVEQIGEALR
jgi:peptide/nickel transport system permease protein